MKSNGEIMDILKVFGQTNSYRETARACGCSPGTVSLWVQRRAKGLLGKSTQRTRTSIIDPYRGKIDELMDQSSGRVRAKAVHRRLRNMGYRGSDRTTRTAVARARKQYRKQNRRVFRPWITEPGHWAQFDWGDGPDIDGKRAYLFCAWLSWSRYRVVLPVHDRKQPSLIGCLAEAMAIFGGVPSHWLTDNQKAVTPGQIARLPIKHPEMVRFGRHYGTSIELCSPEDPATKGGAENCVKLAKSDILPRSDLNLRPQYRSFGELADACDQFMGEVNTRPHRITGRAPIEMLEEERRSLHPLPRTPFAAALGRERRVDPGNGLIAWQSSWYSVPSDLAGEKVLVREQGDQLIVTARTDNGGWREVARHRLAERNQRVVDEDHYQGDPPPGALRREARPQNALENEFLGIGPGAGAWLRAACDTGSARLTEKLEEIAELARLHGAESVNAALAVAEQCERFGFGDIASIMASSSPSNLHRPSEDAFPRQATLEGWKDFGVNGERDA